MAAHRKPEEREEDIVARHVHIEEALKAEAARINGSIEEITEKVSGHAYLTVGLEYTLNVIEWVRDLLKGEGDAHIHGSTTHTNVSED